MKNINFGNMEIMQRKFSAHFVWSKLDYIHMNPMCVRIIDVKLFEKPKVDVSITSSFDIYLSQK